MGSRLVHNFDCPCLWPYAKRNKPRSSSRCTCDTYTRNYHACEQQRVCGFYSSVHRKLTEQTHGTTKQHSLAPYWMLLRQGFLQHLLAVHQRFYPYRELSPDFVMSPRLCFRVLFQLFYERKRKSILMSFRLDHPRIQITLSAESTDLYSTSCDHNLEKSN